MTEDRTETKPMGTEKLSVDLKTQMLRVVEAKAALYPKDDKSDEAKMTREAFKWTNGESKDALAPITAYRIIRDAAFWANYHGDENRPIGLPIEQTPIGARLEKLHEALKPYFVTKMTIKL